MKYQELKDKLSIYGQEHVLHFWSDLNVEQKELLAEQIKTIDFELVQNLIELTHQSKDKNAQSMEPDTLVSLSERQTLDTEMRARGEEFLRKGKVGAFLVAGGQGSRLGFDGPKGILPITPLKEKSLFQFHAEKIRATSIYYNVVIPWYIMTSEANHESTIDFFKKHKYFGLESKNVLFFKQEMLPAINQQGKLILDEKHKLFMSPNGHGGSIKAIWDSGALKDMRQRGIECLFYFQVDNVLLNICEPEFIGYHLAHRAQMSSKVVRKAYPEEKMGVICRLNGVTGVVEYSDLSDEDMYARTADGELKYWAGSIAVHILNVDFIEHENISGFRLPYHVALKNIPFIDLDGKRVTSDKKNGYKFESFVFDALPHCTRTISIETAREDEFSAVKNASGNDSPETARRDLTQLYKRWLGAAGVTVPDTQQINIEISPLFAFSRQMLCTKKNLIPKITKDTYLGN